jgi:predicted amidohydrolase
MSKVVKVAAVQMNGEAAPTGDRLARADGLAEQAAGTGASLVILPELFNTGYGYSDANHYRAEPITGQTVSWMKETAARHHIHLAGTLLLLDEDEVYNAMLLFAPDGRSWRYDKIYPWAWERGYFRNGRDITVADTDLGRIGMLICWDIGHSELWRRYAGRVDMMVISSCPPNISRADIHLPDGQMLDFGRLSPQFEKMSDQTEKVFGPLLETQVGWLNVPAIHASSAGRLKTALPFAKASLVSTTLLYPGSVKLLSQADQMTISCDFAGQCKIMDSSGRILSKLSIDQGDGFIVSEVELADKRPQPNKAQPSMPVLPMTYIFSDYVLPWLTIPIYRRGLRRAWGQNMAPLDSTTRQWMVVVVIAAFLGFLSGRLLKKSHR